MSARCFVDTCGITWEEVVVEGIGPAYQASIKHDASLVCDAEGLGVDIFEDATNLVVSAQGTPLLVQLPVGEVDRVYEKLDDRVAGTQVNSQVQDDVTSSGTFQNSPYPHSWVNDTGRPAIVVVSGTFNLDYAILGPGSNEDTANIIRLGGVAFPAVAGAADAGRLVVPFNAHWHTRLRYGIDDGTTPSFGVQDKFATSGMISTFIGDNVYQFQSERRQFVDLFRVEIGETLTVRGDIAHAGDDQTINVIARGSGPLADLGFGLRDLKFGIIPTR